ncbi:NUDIX hydrolase [Glaciimonas sp. CA11.2]|uniref:NUDIX hydrolase n=1 Tax=unclassified Glaciimonas TaxID=2644401 RepID=UPI002AB45DF6|nr:MULTISPECIES: NUDIX hydrolase [unclassified Glaciimonas]MDY7545159.1 NUDIX hydrolase [Glaciimonas sp. CA11.2]MEB0011343.1 NUDIX hydrolase [Glaciimonas sp. Cout2]MEB0080993.1 NUDIX hydrolase [Glaciimonas sp. Gout2]MEB0163469.1 NUDIX hydrolase [Glaciimonas sp. CA11.2]
MTEVWKPSATVAAIIERDGHFLLVEEHTNDGLRINQPAGHLDPHESLIQAVVRETLEETAHDFTPTALIGTYLASYYSARTGESATYLRFVFCGTVGKIHNQPLDEGIVGVLWMSRDELAACPERHRSPQVLQCIDDYLRGDRVPLSTLHTHASALTHHNDSGSDHV